MKIAIVTDSNSGIYPEEAKELGVWVVPMPVNIDGEEYLETINLERDFFYEKQEGGSNITTSQPSPGLLTDLWEELLETHDGVLYIPMTSGLSSSYATAVTLSAEYEGKVRVVDAKRISVPMWQVVQDAIVLVNKGLTLDEVWKRLEENAMNSSIYITTTTLEYLKRGGRITPAAAAIGTVLNIKPVLQIQGGGVDAYAKVRGMKQAVEKMFTALENDLKTRFAGQKVHIFAAYSGDRELGKTWKAVVQNRFPGTEVRCDPLALCICCHTGPCAVGVGCATYEE